MVGAVMCGRECVVRKGLICCCISGMTNGLQCQCQFPLIGSGCLVGCVERILRLFLGLMGKGVVIRDVSGVEGDVGGSVCVIHLHPGF